MIFVMASVMAVQAGLIYQVQFSTAIATTAGAAAAAMLFIYQGAFTIGFQATVWVSSIWPFLTPRPNVSRCIPLKFYHFVSVNEARQSLRQAIGY